MDSGRLLYRVICAISFIYGIASSCVFVASITVLTIGTQSKLGLSVGLHLVCVSWGGFLLLLCVVFRQKRGMSALFKWPRGILFAVLGALPSLAEFLCVLHGGGFGGTLHEACELISAFSPTFAALILLTVFLLAVDGEVGGTLVARKE